MIFFILLVLQLLLLLNCKARWSVFLPSLMGFQILWQEERIFKHEGGVKEAWIVYEKTKLGIKAAAVKKLLPDFSVSAYLRVYNLKYTNFLSLRDTWSVIASAVIAVDASGKQGKIKTKTKNLLKKLCHLLDPCRGLNWLNIRDRERNFCGDYREGCMNK